MLWILASLFFWWMIFREIKHSRVPPKGYPESAIRPVSWPYVAVLLVLALALAWTPFQRWKLERMLSAKATELADGRVAKVHCNTIVDMFLDSNYLYAGHANFETGEIVLQPSVCTNLKRYLSHPHRASRAEIESLNVFTHESMHVRGERNEALTECQAVQRNYRAAKLLGVPDDAARKSALDYYYVSYMNRGKIGGIQAPYFSDQCAPGKAMDERLNDSTWATIRR